VQAITKAIAVVLGNLTFMIDCIILCLDIRIIKYNFERSLIQSDRGHRDRLPEYHQNRFS
jgi:hypothetical protein